MDISGSSRTADNPTSHAGRHAGNLDYPVLYAADFSCQVQASLRIRNSPFSAMCQGRSTRC